jgi:hypothetical protein
VLYYLVLNKRKVGFDASFESHIWARAGDEVDMKQAKDAGAKWHFEMDL